MTNPWIETSEVQTHLAEFFTQNKSQIQDFGNTVNQTFEAFVFASLVQWYASHDWSIEFKHPNPNTKHVKLKFSTRGQPGSYSYAICTKGEQRIQIRHGLRVATRHHRAGLSYSANVVLDVAVISDTDLSKHKTNDHVDNLHLITFGEAKHMSAFAELIANFIGLVHELLPDRIDSLQVQQVSPKTREHPAPFLYVSGYLYPTAQGIVETIKQRGLDIEICDYLSGSELFGIKLPVKFKPRPRKTKKVVMSDVSTEVAS